MARNRIAPARQRRAVRPGVLLFAFAFAVMADPVSSVAYAIEAGLRSLAGDLLLLVPTMLIVLGIISVIRLNYDQLIRRFPQGDGDRLRVATNTIGAALVLFTIAVNLRRGYPIASLAASVAIGGLFMWLWRRQGRPRGIAMAEAEAERIVGEELED